MPDGKTHAFATVAASLAAPFILHGLGWNTTTPNEIAAAAGCLLGILITPDLDVNTGCASMRTIQRRLGKPAASAWRAIWLPYAALVPHRSWVSHLPIVGTVLRLGYLYVVYFLIALVLGALGILTLPRIPLTWQTVHSSNFLWAFAGLALADTLHFAMDRFL